MSTRTRALLIGMFGPGLSLLGVLWVIANVLLDTGRELTFRYLIFDPGHLVIVVGVLVTVVSIPVASQVAAAAPEDVELELFDAQPAERPSGQPAEVPGRTWETAE